MIEEPPSITGEAPQESDCRKLALKYLSKREYSRHELSLKLRRKGCTSRDCETVLARLCAEHLLSDQRYAEIYLQSKVRRGYGPTRIRMNLEESGVPRDVIDAAFEQIEIEWSDQLKLQHVKKFGHTEPASYKEWVKRARYLNNRGFSSDLIHNVLEFTG